MKKVTKEEIEQYMRLPWEEYYRLKRISEEDGGGFMGYVIAFGKAGCRSDGDTPEEAIRNLRPVLEGVIYEHLRREWTIPVVGSDGNAGDDKNVV